MRKYFTLIIILYTLSATVGFAQPPDTLWTRTYGGNRNDHGFSVQHTMDDGFVFAGYTHTANPDNSLFNLVKTDANGNLLWSRTWNHADWWDECYSVQQTSDSGYILAGGTYSSGAGNWDFWVVKTNANGDSLWSRTFGGTGNDVCNALDVTSDGGFVFAGHTNSFGNFYEFWLIKTDANGNSLWSRTYSTGFFDQCYSIQQTSDSGYILAGSTSDNFGDSDFWLVKTDANGDSLWSSSYSGGDRDEFCYSVAQTSDGGYILGGDISPVNGDLDFWLVKTDSNGNELWNRHYGGNAHEGCRSVIQTTDGNYISAGHTQSFGAGNTDWWVIRTDANGDSLWSRTFGGTGFENCRSVQQTTNGGYVLAGSTSSRGAGGVDFWLIKLEPEEQPPRPGVLVTPTLLDFATVFVGDSATLQLFIFSTGSADLTVNEILAPADFYTDFGGAMTLASGESLRVQITFTPTLLQTYSDTLWIHSNALDSVIVVRVLGVGAGNSVHNSPVLPQHFGLATYPNPFNSTATITLDLPSQLRGRLVAYDALGREVRTLIDGTMRAGSHDVRFDGTGLSSGNYFVRFESPQLSAVQKAVLVK